MSSEKPNRVELVQKISEILKTDCADPVESMIAEAEAMLKIARALRGQGPAEARAIMRAVANLI
jgi:hypothetical protein